MAAYVIAYLQVTDAKAFEAYRKLAAATFAPYGGKAIVPRYRYPNPGGDDLDGARPENGSPPGSNRELLVEGPDIGPTWIRALGQWAERVEDPEQREEDRHLEQDRQARGERVGTVLPVERHHLRLHLLA